MTKFEIATVQGSMLMPRFEHAQVRDVMRPGVISCEPDMPLRGVAAAMATNHVHAVVVTLGDDLWGVVSAVDVLQVAGAGAEELTAGQVAATECLTIEAGAQLEEAAQLMREHEVAHLVVESGGRPVGVLSTLDIAGAIAWGEI